MRVAHVNYYEEGIGSLDYQLFFLVNYQVFFLVLQILLLVEYSLQKYLNKDNRPQKHGQYKVGGKNAAINTYL